MGLWLIQQARIALGAATYEQLTAEAEHATAFTAFIDPDDVRFLRASHVPQTVEAYCRETHQPPPPDAGTLVRVLLESLALKYAYVIQQLEHVTGRNIEALHVVGGGAQNRLLCQMTANATGLPVLARAIEATAIGNLLVQAIALGEIQSLKDAREVVTRSFGVETYAPKNWLQNSMYSRVKRMN